MQMFSQQIAGFPPYLYLKIKFLEQHAHHDTNDNDIFDFKTLQPFAPDNEKYLRSSNPNQAELSLFWN